MKPKLLFWLDPGLYHFGIAKSIQDSLDCEIYGIVDINSGKPFFENQEIVNFNKLWFFRDNINISNKTDQSYLEELEEKYSLNIWKIIMSDQIFNEYNKYYNFSKEEILSIVTQECKLIESILNEINPDFVIMRMTDFSNIQFFHHICMAKKIPILTLTHTRIGRCMISNDTDKFDNDELIFTKIQNPKSFSDLQKIITDYSKQQSSYTHKFRSSTYQKLLASFKLFFKTYDSSYSKYFEHYGRSRRSIIHNEVSNQFRAHYRKYFLDKYSTKNPDFTLKFIYFPLQLDPERSTLIQSPFYVDQLHVIKLIAKAIPIDFLLYVKEHPRQKTMNWREKSVYRILSSMPNVRLIHPKISNEDMIKNCSMVITITGTAGMQAAFYEKPSIVFSDTVYSRLPSVKKINSISDLPKLIKSSLDIKIIESDLQNYLEFVEKNSFDFDLFDLYSQINHSFYFDGHLKDVEIPIDTMKSFLDTHNEKFKKLAFEHIKKIKN